MKYKNRLIIPTLLSTSLIASSMVASADEMETEEQSFEENLQVQYSDEENTDQEADKDEDSSVAEDEELENSEEDKTKDYTGPESENTAKITEDEVTAEETTEEDNTEVETEQDLSVEEKTVSESPDQVEQDPTVEETSEELEEVEAEENNNTEVVAEETEQEVTTEENTVPEDVEEVVNEENTTTEVEETENNNSEAVTEEVEQEVPTEEVVVEDDETETNTTSEVEASENKTTEEITEEVEKEVTQEEEVSNEVEENVTEEDSSSEVQEDVQEEMENSSTDETKEEQNKINDSEAVTETEEVAESKEETKEENTSEETDQVDESSEDNEKESENNTDKAAEKESETATYKYDSETLVSELENKSASERAQFLEENADDIEADEALLSELSEAVEAEHGIEIDENQVFSTFSTMSMSQAITDINSYIEQQNFEVAEIQYDIIDHLPLYAYESNIGWNPENGKVGQPSGVVLHDVGNDNSTIYGEIEYMSRNWENAFVHAFVDADNIIQVANTDYLAYGAGPVSNEIHLQVELVRHDNQHDFARSINNYADYVANLLYKYKLPAERADSSGNGTLWSHVEVSNILGGTASPDPYEYFQTHGYAYEDLISLIQGRYNNLYNKVTTPSIYMPTFEGDTSNLAGNITNQNRGIYESITDVRTSDASNYLDQEFRIVRSEIYNYEEYYLLESIEDGTTIGWMYAGDVYTSALDEKPVEEPEKEKPSEEETPAEENKPEAPEKDDDSEETENEAPVEEPKPEEPKEDTDSEKTEDEKPAQEAKPETPEKDTDSKETAEDDVENDQLSEETDSEDTDETDKETSEDVDEDVSSEDSPQKPEQENSGESDDDTNQSSEKPEMEDSKDDTELEKDDSKSESNEVNNESSDTDDSETQVSENDSEEAKTDKDESNNSDDDNKSETANVSSLVDSATGVKVYSATDELLGKSLAVTVLNPSKAINAPHDLYDIHILNSDGSLYDLKNPVTVYLPANGYVSNLYYLGDIGETLEAVSYRTEDDYVVFDVSSFSQYAVVYGESTDENTVVPPTSDDNSGNDDSVSGENNHSKVYTEAVDDSVEVATVETQDDKPTSENEEQAEVLPNTGVDEQSTTILATVLAALGLGFLVRRRKVKENK